MSVFGLQLPEKKHLA